MYMGWKHLTLTEAQETNILFYTVSPGENGWTEKENLNGSNN